MLAASYEMLIPINFWQQFLLNDEYDRNFGVIKQSIPTVFTNTEM